MGVNWDRVEWTPFVEAEAAPDTDAITLAATAGDRIFLNSRYQVNVREFVHPTLGPVCHLSIKTRDRSPRHDWRDFQRIKNELCGEECEGIELYPAESRLVDSSNQYHLWVFATDVRVPVGFTERFVMEEEWGKARQRPFDPDVRPGDCLSRAEFEVKAQEFLKQRGGHGGVED